MLLLYNKHRGAKAVGETRVKGGKSQTETLPIGHMTSAGLQIPVAGTAVENGVEG
jgi:hypothetical protein